MAHNACPKCGASISGDNKSCNSCGSVCLPPVLAFCPTMIRAGLTAYHRLALFKSDSSAGRIMMVEVNFFCIYG
ncbi:hypothetical protein BDV09DRAFT_16277 [Aspergillus tetrazonus]